MKRTLRVLQWMAVAAFVAANQGASAATTWPAGGQDIGNSRYQDKESKISTATVSGLQLKWTVNTSGDVTASPAVDTQAIYFPDSAGFLYKVDRKTGAVMWK